MAPLDEVRVVARHDVDEATHSPLLAAFPGGAILELGDHGIRPASWEDLDVVAHWRSFLDEPRRYLRHL